MFRSCLQDGGQTHRKLPDAGRGVDFDQVEFPFSVGCSEAVDY